MSLRPPSLERIEKWTAMFDLEVSSLRLHFMNTSIGSTAFEMATNSISFHIKEWKKQWDKEQQAQDGMWTFAPPEVWTAIEDLRTTRN